MAEEELIMLQSMEEDEELGVLVAELEESENSSTLPGGEQEVID